MQAAQCIGEDDASIVRRQLGEAIRSATHGLILSSLPEEIRLLLEILETQVNSETVREQR